MDAHLLLLVIASLDKAFTSGQALFPFVYACKRFNASDSIY